MQPLQLRWFWLSGGAGLIAIVLYAALVRAGNAPTTGFGDFFDHAACFVVLTLWFSGIAAAQLQRALGVALFLFGVALEWAQYATALGRVADPADLAADAVGIAIGLVLASNGLGDWMRQVEARVLRL